MGLLDFVEELFGLPPMTSPQPAPPSAQPARAARGSSPPPAREPVPPPALPQVRALSGDVAISRQEFRVIGSIDAATGSEIWVVTNGRDRAECGSQEFALRVRAALG
jgi:hypothetical protein